MSDSLHLLTESQLPGREGGREGGREERREGRREGGREGGRERGREGGREGGRERREGGREGGDGQYGNETVPPTWWPLVSQTTRKVTMTTREPIVVSQSTMSQSEWRAAFGLRTRPLART